MSDRWLKAQHDEVKERNRQARQARMNEVDARARAANARRHK
jgi:hypothetical protein